jgi:hypothetical protein
MREVPLVSVKRPEEEPGSLRFKGQASSSLVVLPRFGSTIIIMISRRVPDNANLNECSRLHVFKTASTVLCKSMVN